MPPGNLIVDHHYYWFSSVFFYTDTTALLLNGRFNNLVYGSYAPNAPDVFIDDSQFQVLWQRPERYYLFAKDTAVDHLESLVGKGQLNALGEGGGKVLLTNHPISSPAQPSTPGVHFDFIRTPKTGVFFCAQFESKCLICASKYFYRPLTNRRNYADCCSRR